MPILQTRKARPRQVKSFVHSLIAAFEPRQPPKAGLVTTTKSHLMDVSPRTGQCREEQGHFWRRGKGGLAAIPRTFELDLESTVKLTIAQVGFVSCPAEEGSRSFQAEGTACEMGSWQVNEVFRRCEKPGTAGGWGKREGLCGWKVGHTRLAG